MNAKCRLGLAAVLTSLVLSGLAHPVVAPMTAEPSDAAPPSVQAALRRNLPAHQPRLGKIDEIRVTPIGGIYEVRVGRELFYSDALGKFVINGEIIDTTSQRNLTQSRMNALLAVDFSQLPVKDAFKIVRGNGKRLLAVFEDPNCGYCRHFETDLQKVDNVTVYMFLYPILGEDSQRKAAAIWCSPDRGGTWQDWMVRGVPIPRTSGCDAGALARNIEFGRRHKITGTPTLLFLTGPRVPGAISAAEVEKRLSIGGR
jgi:thiol:disulfide interchange protein DsbC